jgi:hypothetical protein
MDPLAHSDLTNSIRRVITKPFCPMLSIVKEFAKFKRRLYLLRRRIKYFRKTIQAILAHKGPQFEPQM